MPTRRTLLAAATALPVLAATRVPASSQAVSTAASSSTAYAFLLEGLDGKTIRLSDHAGRVLMVVNTASSCGFTPQFADLQTVYARYRERGLTVIGVPSDDFNQERGTAADIAAVCQGIYGVAFPMAAKQRVTGRDAHPLYRWLANQKPTDIPTWNFHKFVISRSGRVVGAFPARVRPTDPRITALIEAELAGA